MRSSIIFAILLALCATLVLAAPFGKEDKKKKHTTKHKTTTTKKHTTTTTKHATTTSKHASTSAVTTVTVPVTTATITTATTPITTATTAITNTFPTTATHTTKPTKTTGVPPTASGKATISILNQSRFCLMLPPTNPPSGSISDNEDRAISFCTDSSLVTGTKVIYPGFIQSAHFVSNTDKGYVQVTGRINRKAAGLSSSDGGGQNDMNAPHGSYCAGYTNYVQLIEPDAQIYCIRCCKNKADCPVNKSTKGCVAVLGGDYS